MPHRSTAPTAVPQTKLDSQTGSSLRLWLAVAFGWGVLLSCGDGKLEDQPSAGAQDSTVPSEQRMETELSVPEEQVDSRRDRPGASGARTSETKSESRGLLRIEIVAGPDVPDGAPIAMYVLDSGAPDAQAAREALRNAPRGAWGALERFGKPLPEELRLDNGECSLQVPAPGQRSYVYARAGRFYGRGRVRRSLKKPLVIKLESLVLDPVTVRVFRSSGEPLAGVAVCGAAMDAIEQVSSTVFDRTSKSDADGRVAAYLEAGQDGFIAQVLGAEPARARRDLEGWRIDLPPMGKLRFVMPVDSEGAVVRATGEGRWRLFQEATAEGRGPIEFDRVAAGVPLQYVAWLGQSKARGDIPPITTDGEFVEVTPEFVPLRRLELWPVQDGEAVDPGTTVVITSVDAERDSKFTAYGRTMVAEPTDEEGRSVMLFDEPKWKPAANGEIQILTFPPRKSQNAPGAAVRTLTRAEASQAVIDLGQVELEPLPLIASGTVVGPLGEPVEGARVSIHQELSEEASLLGAGGRLGGNPNERAYADRATDRTDAKGRFSLRGIGDATLGGRFDLFVNVGTSGFAESKNTAFQQGDADLEVRLSHEGSMAIDPGNLEPEVAARLNAGVEHQDTGDTRPVQTVRTSKLSRLAAGTYTLTVDCFGVEALRIEGLQVPDGGECRDPRLKLRLQDLVGSRRFRVLGVGGKPIEWVMLHQEHALNGERSSRAFKSAGGLALIPIPTRVPMRRHLAAPGYLATDVTDLADGATVVLEALQELTISFEGDGAPRPGQEVTLSVPPALASSPGLGDQMQGWVDEDGTVTLHVPRPGNYDLRIESTLASAGRSLGTVNVNGPSAVVSVSGRR